jgi:hypothetical protein
VVPLAHLAFELPGVGLVFFDCLHSFLRKKNLCPPGAV